MDTYSVIFLGVVFIIAFGIGGYTARRFVPAIEGEHWTRGGKRNVITMVIGWGILGIAAAAVLLLGN